MGSTSGSSDSSRGELQGARDAAVLQLLPPPVKKTKHQAPQDAIDDFWVKFNSKTPGQATTVLPKNVYAKKAGESVPKGVIKGENAVASYEEAAKICRDKVEKIVKECRRVNQKYRDPHFDIEFDLKWGTKDCLTMLSGQSDGYQDGSFRPGSVKRVGDIFEKPEFYKSGATANDIRQGRDGDCWFMAALCTLGNKPGLIEKVCVARDEQIGVYGFVFHRDGEWRSEVIDDKLYLTKPDYDESWIERNLIEDRQRINSEEDYRKIYQTGSGALYFAQCEDPNETWLPLLEKAYAKAHGDYAAIEGGFTGEGLEDLTGGVTTEILSTDILDKEYFWKEELLKVNKDFLFGCAAGIFYGRGYRKGIYEGHAYSVMRAVEIDGQRLLLLRNPWGQGEWAGPWSDGSKEWTPEWMQKLDHRFGDDGAFWMSYDDFLRKYQTFDRTRLFTDDWKVTQQWTSLTVPWSVGYNDTKFSFTLQNDAPAVIVLSQLDERYFCGLEGQYNFELSFRIHKAGEEDYVVRSHGNYCMRRSVTAELVLPKGEYDVLMKVEAVRSQGALPVEEVVRNNAKSRRDKLLRIGMAYDLAHAKGHIIETEEEKKGRKALAAKKKAKEKKELKEKLMLEKKKRKHNENREKRKERAAKAKRAAKKKAVESTKAAKKAEKEKAEKEKAEKEKAEKEKATTEGTPKASEEKTAAEETKSGAEEKTEKSTAATSDKTAETATTTTEPKSSESTVEKDTEKAPADDDKKPADPTKVKEKGPESSTIDSLVPKPPASSPVSPLVSDAEDDDDPSLDSDIESTVSDISSAALSDELEASKLAADAANPLPLPLPMADEEEDEFQRDPWNAVVVVGLRVYSREAGVTVKVVRPRDWEVEEEGEGRLDLDDSAADVVREVLDAGKEREETKKEEKEEEEEKKDDRKEAKKEEEDKKVTESKEADAIPTVKVDPAPEEVTQKEDTEKAESDGSSIVVV